MTVVKCQAQTARVNFPHPLTWLWAVKKIGVFLNPELQPAQVQTGGHPFWSSDTFTAKGLELPFLLKQCASAFGFSRNSFIVE